MTAFLYWWGIAFALGLVAILLLGPLQRDRGGPYTLRQAWGFILAGVAVGWFLRGPFGV